MPRQNRGTVVRHPLDFAIRRGMAGTFTMAASVGNLGHVELFNNDPRGNYLYPYAVNASPGAVNQFSIESYFGQKATTIGTALTDYGPLLIGGPLLSGVLGGFYSAVCVGTHIGMVPGLAGGGTDFFEFALAAVPPGYSFCIEETSQNQSIVGGIWWVVDAAP